MSLSFWRRVDGDLLLRRPPPSTRLFWSWRVGTALAVLGMTLRLPFTEYTYTQYYLYGACIDAGLVVIR